MSRDIKRSMEEGAEMIARDTMPPREPNASELKARELTKEYATKTLDEYRAKVEKDPAVRERLSQAFDEALKGIMLDDDLSADDHGDGERFFKAAQAEKPAYIKFLMNEMINKHLDAEEAITTSGKGFMNRMENRPN